jgi:hypothetical protein
LTRTRTSAECQARPTKLPRLPTPPVYCTNGPVDRYPDIWHVCDRAGFRLARSYMFPNLPDGCPPPDAVDANGVYYHLVGASPLRNTLPDADCRSKCEKDGPESDGCKRCNACGLSVFPSVASARAQYALNAEKYPRVARKHMGFIAKATLTPGLGKIKVTGGSVPDHTTWWFVKALDISARCAMFVVVGPSDPASDGLGG